MSNVSINELSEKLYHLFQTGESPVELDLFAGVSLRHIHLATHDSLQKVALRISCGTFAEGSWAEKVAKIDSISAFVRTLDESATSVIILQKILPLLRTNRMEVDLLMVGIATWLGRFSCQQAMQQLASLIVEEEWSQLRKQVIQKTPEFECAIGVDDCWDDPISSALLECKTSRYADISLEAAQALVQLGHVPTIIEQIEVCKPNWPKAREFHRSLSQFRRTAIWPRIATEASEIEQIASNGMNAIFRRMLPKLLEGEYSEIRSLEGELTRNGDYFSDSLLREIISRFGPDVHEVTEIEWETHEITSIGETPNRVDHETSRKKVMRNKNKSFERVIEQALMIQNQRMTTGDSSLIND